MLLPVQSALCRTTIIAYVPPDQRAAPQSTPLTVLGDGEALITVPAAPQKARSYGHLLAKEITSAATDLDNPSLRTGRHRTVIALTSFRVLLLNLCKSAAFNGASLCLLS